MTNALKAMMSSPDPRMLMEIERDWSEHVKGLLKAELKRLLAQPLIAAGV